MRWQPYVGSVVVHAVLIGIALHAGGAAPVEDPVHEQPAVELIDVSVAPAAAVDDGGGGGAAVVGMALQEEQRGRARARAAASEDADAPIVTGIDDGTGIGNRIGTQTGAGIGNGIGTGIGDGIGNGIGNGVGGTRLDPRAELRQLPAPPPPPVSKARPAKLLHPTRQTEVDEAELFAARITVDETGDVVGAHMTQSHPGSRGEVASSMIWQFRYAPALDDDGMPVRSTFVQTFAVR